MGFYGNITNINKSSFSFDKIYANRKEMDQNADSDGVYVGRYVLVDYDKKSILATQASEVANSFNASNDPLNYTDIVEGFKRYYNYNLDLLERKTNSNLRPAWMIIQTDGTETFHTGPSYRTPVYKFDDTGANGLKVGDLVLLLGKRRCTSEIPDALKYSEAYELETYQESELASITTDANGAKTYFIPEIWSCIGGRKEVFNNGQSELNIALFNKTSIAYSELVDMNNPTLFNSNYSEDAVAYGSIGRGWDSTVWQKTTTVESGTNRVINKYVMIAELNSVVPTIDISVDAPTQNPIPPHYGSNVSNVYYNMHLQPSWGMRVKSAVYDQKYTEDSQRYPSDISGDFIINILNNDGTITEYARGIKTVDGVTSIIDYDPDNNYFSSNGTITNELEQMPLAIYFNKAGFDPYKGSDALKTVERKYGTNALNAIAKKKDAAINSGWTLDDTIKIKPTGKSDQQYNVHKDTGELIKENAKDTYEMSVMLPTIGNMANQFWNMVYGENTYQDMNGRSIWHVETGGFASAGDEGSYVRNTEFRWNTKNGLRGIAPNIFNSSFYIGGGREKTPKTYDAMLAMKGTLDGNLEVFTKDLFKDKYISWGTIDDYDPDTMHPLTDFYQYNVKNFNTVTGTINTLHDLAGMIIRHTTIEENDETEVDIFTDTIADITDSSQLDALWEPRKEQFNDWDPTKIYYDVSKQRYYYKKKTYEYVSTLPNMESEDGKWYKPISGDTFIDLSSKKYYRAERMEYPEYSETNLTKNVTDLPYFDYILAKSEDDYVEGAKYYQIYNADYVANHPVIKQKRIPFDAVLNDENATEEEKSVAQSQLNELLAEKRYNLNEQVVLKYPSLMELYDVGYEPGVYSYEEIDANGQRKYTLDTEPLPSKPDLRYVKITFPQVGSNDQQYREKGYVLYTPKGFYRWDNKDEKLMLCQNATLKGALGLPDSYVPDDPTAELATDNKNWNPLIPVYDEEGVVVDQIHRYDFFPNNATFQAYLHSADSDDDTTIYVAGDEVPDITPINFPPAGYWEIVFDDDSKEISLYIYATQDNHAVDITNERRYDKIPLDNILFKRDSYKEELTNRLQAYKDTLGTIQKNNLLSYIGTLNTNTGNRYFEQYQAYSYKFWSVPPTVDPDTGEVTVEGVSDYLPYWQIIINGHNRPDPEDPRWPNIEHDKKVPKMVISTIGKESATSSIRFNRDEIIDQLGVVLKEFKEHTYYFHPLGNTNVWISEVRANLLTESGMSRNTYQGSEKYNGYWKVQYETLYPESQEDDFDEVNDNDNFKFFTLDRNISYRYQDVEGNWKEEIISRTYPRRDITYYDIKFLRVPDTKIPFHSNKYYEKVEGHFVLSADTTPQANKTYYEYCPRYVYSDSAGVYHKGAVWNEEVYPVPNTIELRFRNDSWEPQIIKSYANYENSVNGLILRQNNLLLDGDELTRDKNTVQGSINNMNDILDKFSILTPGEFITVDEYGRIHSADWDTRQRDFVVNYGTGDVVDDRIDYSDRWIKVELDDDKDNPHFTIVHTSTSKPDTTTVSDKNTGITPNGLVGGLNQNTNDTIDLYTPIVDGQGHIVGRNTETVTLPYGFKTITTNGRLSNDNTASLSAQDNIVADNTQDTLAINSGNEWIKIETNSSNDTITISHDAKVTSTSTDTASLSNEDSSAVTFSIPTYSFDATNHYASKSTLIYTMPNSYGKFTGDSGSSEATATHDTFSITGDSWIQTTASTDAIAFAHIGPVATTHVTVNNETPAFGSSFTIVDWTFDDKGHKANSGSHTITIPKGSLTTNEGIDNAKVLTSFAFVDTSGAMTVTNKNVGELALTGLTAASSISAIPSASDSINTAISKLSYILDNDTTQVNTRITNAIEALDSSYIAGGASAGSGVTSSSTVNVISKVDLVDGKVTNNSTSTLVDAAGAAAAAKSEVIGTNGDASTESTVYGAKAFATSAANSAVTSANGYTDTAITNVASTATYTHTPDPIPNLDYDPEDPDSQEFFPAMSETRTIGEWIEYILTNMQ